MKLIANRDEKLKQHMDKQKLKNTTYLSPRTQNEVTEVLGMHIIKARLVEEIKDAQIYSIITDEVISHNSEIMPICIRFVDKSLDIREKLPE